MMPPRFSLNTDLNECTLSKKASYYHWPFINHGSGISHTEGGSLDPGDRNIAYSITKGEIA